MNLISEGTQEVETPLRKLYKKPAYEKGRYSGKKEMDFRDILVV